MESLFIILAALISPALTVTSTAFKNGKNIPEQYTCEGKNINPPISINGVPDKAESLVLIMDDPDAPNGGFTHWVLYNISPKDKTIKEDSSPGKNGENGAGKASYTGPCPPSGVHHY